MSNLCTVIYKQVGYTGAMQAGPHGEVNGGAGADALFFNDLFIYH